MTFIHGVAGAFHFFQDVGGSRSPDEWFRTLVVAVDVGAEGHDVFFQVAEYATPEPILSQVAKEAFHHVELGRAGRSEVHMKTRMPHQPALHFGMLMTRVVIAGTTDSQTCNYYYDDLARLAGKDAAGYSVDCGTKWQQLFTLDPFGNIIKAGTSNFAPTYSTSTNQFSTIPGVTGPYYDSNGNLTKDNLNTYTWDPNWGSPASLNSTNLIYDANGLMVEQQNGSASTHILYGPAGKTAIMSGQTLVKAFVGLPDGATAIYTPSSGSPAYYRHPDWLGSARLTSTAARGVYSDSAYAPYGEQYAPVNPADPSFTGQNSDTTASLYDFPFREHSPTQGRWSSPDPAGLGAVDPTNPQTWNRYAYVINNPLTFVDPFGLCDPNDPWCFQTQANICGNPSLSYYPPYGCVPTCDGMGLVEYLGWLFCGPPANIGQIIASLPPIGSGTSGGGGAANNGTPTAPPKKSGCGLAIAQGALSVGVDIVGAIPGFGNAVSATAAGARAVNGIVAYGGAAYGIATGLPDESPFGAASAGAGLGLTLADAALEGGKVIPVIGNALSVVTGAYDTYQLVKTIQGCRSGG
jgi:RHS repeat-associated protein